MNKLYILLAENTYSPKIPDFRGKSGKLKKYLNFIKQFLEKKTLHFITLFYTILWKITQFNSHFFIFWPTFLILIEFLPTCLFSGYLNNLVAFLQISDRSDMKSYIRDKLKKKKDPLIVRKEIVISLINKFLMSKVSKASNIPNYVSGSENDIEMENSTVQERKRREKRTRNWIIENANSNKQAAMDFIKNENTWSLHFNNKAQNGNKTKIKC
ncbi:hypothetical protein BpHYR1_015522 [Brachionus plicatilis]|uniref:Uncharacterized protein n=1 Tax=Brachionus plicatilis TaxID=10195 RepID=A0A3M7QMA0_BRAPC|nr:hypothetical protein BpHYR1_015522 [Brachionus plicatilis]